MYTPTQMGSIFFRLCKDTWVGTRTHPYTQYKGGVFTGAIFRCSHYYLTIPGLLEAHFSRTAHVCQNLRTRSINMRCGTNKRLQRTSRETWKKCICFCFSECVCVCVCIVLHCYVCFFISSNTVFKYHTML